MADQSAHSRSRMIFDQRELAYDFGPDHPMKPRRLVALMDLLKTSGLWESGDEQTRLPFRAATKARLEPSQRNPFEKREDLPQWKRTNSSCSTKPQKKNW